MIWLARFRIWFSSPGQRRLSSLIVACGSVNDAKNFGLDLLKKCVWRSETDCRLNLLSNKRSNASSEISFVLLDQFCLSANAAIACEPRTRSSSKPTCLSLCNLLFISDLQALVRCRRVWRRTLQDHDMRSSMRLSLLPNC